ncbi:competence/damage-inducible protein A [Hirschia baltica]|uniref:Molybdopterin binding domain protein n=1 Tax=Hirschia baltica (strain ATCC 49814 / DSM 5838 / IFAM 1418) TaxID=582402 RepID=C6XNR5_HIRBI|nr:molybdopterin-binding protein [Hirschia baltica]ACT58318.1 molybdopterin binding domain protein [Hirschia baltica ATCC 49814]
MPAETSVLQDVTAGVLLIGDEILSGRTQDTNLKTIADFLSPLGIRVAQARVIADDAATIIESVRALSSAYDYVFTTGGIGPTHDDITAECIAKAFNVGISVRDDARKVLEDWYAQTDSEVTDARLRMARIPDGARLIPNPVSGAPGFIIENVHVMAGVPRIMKAMLHNIGPNLKGGAIVYGRTLRADGLREGDIAVDLGILAEKMPDLSFGSYPWFTDSDSGVALVVRGVDEVRLEVAEKALIELATKLGKIPEVSRH